MLRSFLNRRTVRSSLVLGFFTLAAKLAGLVRDRVLASHFGAGPELDVYYSAFRLPDLVFNLLVLGALSAAFIPIFVEYLNRDSEEGWRVANNFVNVAFTGTLIASIAMAIFARPLSYVVAPGFGEAERALLVTLLRIMLLSPLIFAVSSSIGSILQSLQRFVAYALAPIFYNIGIILGALYLVPLAQGWGYRPAVGLAAGVVLGAMLHLLVQLPAVLRAGFRFRAVFDLRSPGLRRIVRLMAPRTFALGAYQVGETLTTAIASFLGAGSITVLNLAVNLEYLPVSIVGISVATAVFPQLSAHASAQDHDRFRAKFQQALRYSFWGVLSAAAVLFFLRNVAVRLYVGSSGAFTAADRATLATALAVFLLGAIPQSLVHVTSRAFYALQDTRTPLFTSLLGITTSVSLAAFTALVLHWGIVGLAASASTGMYVYFTTSYLLLRRRL